MDRDRIKLLERLSHSAFRNRFHLSQKDKKYIQEKGLDTIEKHAYKFINKRLAPSFLGNDGSQTPMKGHPVFLAQHATATCCRGCLAKWYGIEKGVPLSEEEQEFIVGVIICWIKKELEL